MVNLDSSRKSSQSHKESTAKTKRDGPRHHFDIPSIGRELHLYGDLTCINPWPTSEGNASSPPPPQAAAQAYIPIHLMQPLNFTDNEVLSRLYSSFLVHHRDLTARGLWTGDLHENPMNVALMLPDFKREEHTNVDPVSIFIADILATFGQVRVPERLGIMHLLYRFIRVSQLVPLFSVWRPLTTRFPVRSGKSIPRKKAIPKSRRVCGRRPCR